MSDRIRPSSVTWNCPEATTLASFYAAITGGEVTFSHPAFATVKTPGGRIDCQTVAGYVAPLWPVETSTALLHLDFLVDDLAAVQQRVMSCGATKFGGQSNGEHCLVFADLVGHPFCLTTIDEMN